MARSKLLVSASLPFALLSLRLGWPQELLVSPHLLVQHSIPVVRVVQYPGEFIINYPGELRARCGALYTWQTVEREPSTPSSLQVALLPLHAAW